jgi:hypothetical protein
MVGTSLETARLFRRFRVGTHVVAECDIFYADSGVEVTAGDKGVVVAPELVQPIVRVIWDDHPGRSFTTNVANLDLCADCTGDLSMLPVPAAAVKRVRERDRAKASGEQVCRVCGCSDRDACPGGCAWVAPDLCSACEGRA